MKKIKVLYLHPIGSFGGASRSLHELVLALPKNLIESYFLTQKGNVVNFFQKLGVVYTCLGMTQFCDTKYGFYRGARWLILLRELYYLPSSILSLLEIKRSNPGIDVIHLNEITGLPTLLLAKIIFKKPTVVHVRSVNRNDGRSWRSQFVSWFLRDVCDKVIAIDENVKSSLPSNIKTNVIHNILNIDSRNEQKKSGKIGEPFRIGFVGNIHRGKGVFEIAESLKFILSKGYDVELVVAGENANKKSIFDGLLSQFGLKQDSKEELIEFMKSNQILHKVKFLGFLEDLRSVYENIDVLCFPSHYDSPGRPVFEAALFGVPSIVAVTEPHDDTFQPYTTGISVTPKSVEELSNAIEYYINSKHECKKMGLAAKLNAKKHFDPQRNGEYLYNIYKSLI